MAVSCKKEIDNLKELDSVTAPANLTAIFDITQDNSGIVTIVPNAEGVTKYAITFGDVEDETATDYDLNETVLHTYAEGVFTVGITAKGLTGLESTIEQDLNVTFKAPENLVVTITPDASNPKIVTFSATADYATIMDIYFGDVDNEEPTHVLPGEEVIHTYSEAGDYLVIVIAKSGGAATANYSETITITAASDPINLPIDFESFTINYAFEDFGNAASSVIDNPDASGINPSSRVATTLKTAGAETWAGSILTLENPMDFDANSLFKVKVWSPKVGAIVKLKVENIDDGDISFEVDATTTVSGEWEELVYDFSSIDASQEYRKVVIFFDFDNPGDDASYYFDDIKLVPSSVPTTKSVEDFEGEAPAFTDFGNAVSQVIANPDVSGINTTATAAEFNKAAGAETWAGTFFETEILDLENFSKIRIKTWSPKSGIIVKVKLENADASITHEVDVINTTANAWEELVYDFSDAPAADYMKVVVFFDFDNAGDGTLYYFDEVELVNEGGGGSSSEIFQNFEGEVPEFTAFGNIADIEVIANPDQSGLNTTANTAQFVKTAGAETWAGCFFGSTSVDLNTYNKIKVKTWSPKSGITVKLKLENADASITHEVDITNTTANEWEELVYDFSDAPVADYVNVVIFFDFDVSGDDSVYYFDEFELTN